MFYNVTVRPSGAMQEHQNVNTTLPLHTALFELERGPCFQLRQYLSNTSGIHINALKALRAACFIAAILLKKRSQVFIVICVLIVFFFFEFYCAFFPPNSTCVVVNSPVPPLSSVQQSVFFPLMFMFIFSFFFI